MNLQKIKALSLILCATTLLCSQDALAGRTKKKLDDVRHERNSLNKHIKNCDKKIRHGKKHHKPSLVEKYQEKKASYVIRLQDKTNERDYLKAKIRNDRNNVIDNVSSYIGIAGGFLGIFK